MGNKFIKRIDNNIYYFCNPTESDGKTIWHFKNYNLIMPNKLGYDINNYIDIDIKVDLRRQHNDIILGRFVSLGNVYINIIDSKFVWLNFSHIYLNSDFSKLYENVEFINNNLIVHMPIIKNPNHKIRKIIVPIDIIKGIGEIIIEYLLYGNYLEFKYNDNKIIVNILDDFDDINIADYDRVSKLILDDIYMVAYNKLLLLNI